MFAGFFLLVNNDKVVAFFLVSIEWVFVDGYKAVTWAHIVGNLSTHEKQIYGTYGQTQLVEKKKLKHTCLKLFERHFLSHHQLTYAFVEMLMVEF